MARRSGRIPAAGSRAPSTSSTLVFILYVCTLSLARPALLFPAWGYGAARQRAAGRYQATIVAQALAENKKGNPELQLTIKPTAFFRGENEVDPIDDGFPRTVFLTMTDQTMGNPASPGWVLQTILSLGFDREDLGDLSPDKPGHFSFIGKQVDAVCQHGDWNGNAREKWSIRRPGNNGVVARPLDKKQTTSLNSRFGKALKAHLGRPNGATPAPVPQALPVATAAREEDIPF